MTRSIITICFLTCFSFLGRTQISHDFSVFSPDGLNFTMVVNGEQVNEAPKANVKMKDIEYDYVQVKIIFEDANIPEINRKVVQIGEPGMDESKAVSTVYKIVNKKGEYKLRFASRTSKKIQEKIIIINN